MHKQTSAVLAFLFVLASGAARGDEPSRILGTWSQPSTGKPGCAEPSAEKRARVLFAPDKVTLTEGRQSKSLPATYRAAPDGVIVMTPGDEQLFKFTPEGLVGALGPTCAMIKLPQ